MEMPIADRSPTIWIMRNDALCIYRNGEIVAMIPDHQFLKVMRNMIEHLDSK